MRFLPLWFLYVFLVLVTYTNTYRGDEERYIMYATNLSHGYYAPKDNINIPNVPGLPREFDNINNLWNGPGYPLVLLPFVLLKLPWLAAKLMNTLFIFMAILYFYSTLRFYMQERPALYFSYLLGISPAFVRFQYILATESLVIFLICGFIFHFCKLHHDNRNSWPQLLIPSVYLGYLALTKVFFGYVILGGLLLLLSLYLWKKRNTLKKTLLVYLFALLCCLPYLFYTYSLTGKIFYWGSAGGKLLYWMSSPYENDLGDVPIYVDVAFNHPDLFEKHQKFYNKLKKLSSIQRDDELKKQAIQNIIHNPSKYFKNWLCNVGRLLFNYPYSNDLFIPVRKKILVFFYIIPNMFLVVFSVLCIYPSYLGRRLIPFEIYAVLLLGLISFGGGSLISAVGRFFLPLYPVFTLWIFFTLARIVKVEVQQ